MRFKLLILMLFLSFNIQAKDVFTVGFIGDTLSASSKNMFDALTIILSEKNNDNYELQGKFFNETDENIVNQIKNGNNLIALTGNINEKHKSIFQNVKDVPVFLIGSEYLSVEDFENIFRLAPSNIDLAKILCRIQISVLYKDKFAILYVEGYDEYLKTAEAYKNTVEKNKGRVDYFRSVDEQRKDFEAILLRLRELKVNTIFFAGGYEQAALLARQASELKVGSDFSSIPDICNKNFIKKAKYGSQGVHFVLPTPPSLYSLKPMRNFLEKYNETHRGNDSKLPYLFDVIDIIDSFIKNKVDKKSFIDYLKEQEFSGVTGKIKFNEKGLREEYIPYFYVIRGKEFLYRKLNASEKELYYKMR